MAFNASKNSQNTSSIPVPTTVEELNVTKTPPITSNPSVKPATIFENPSTKKMLDLLENRQPLANTDIEIKTKLINSLPADSETIYAATDYNIDYIQPLDEFQVEILTTNIQQAKTEAVSWFTGQGMTHDGICKLPLVFYTNIDIFRQLKSQGLKDTTPLAEGC